MKSIAALIATLLLSIAAFAAESWYPSRYGAADTLGAVNNLSAAKVLEAVRLIKEGKTYSLGVPIGPDTPAWGSRSYGAIIQRLDEGNGLPPGKNRVTGHDDFLHVWLGIGSQIDGLGHIGIDHVYYNGVPGSDFLTATALTKFSTHELPPIVTRGVLLDMRKHLGQNPVAAGTAFNRAEIDAAAKAQGVSIGHGDVVLFYTGWLALADTDPARFIASEPGLGIDGARYLAGLGVVAVGSDTWALEAQPAEDSQLVFPVHQELLTKNGVYILENMDTAALAADAGYEFMFVLGQPKFVGTVQAVINPIAIR
jgi:kynurenine formamidase